MQILYLWINKYKNLEKIGIPFTGEYSFITEYDDSGQLARLLIEPNEEYIPGFFESNNLSEVTLLVGRNGSGKTSIIELLRNVLAEGDRITYQEMLIIVRDDSSGKILIKAHRASTLSTEIVLNNSRLEPESYDLDPPPPLQSRINLRNTPTIVHYSNTLSFQTPVEYKGVIDITTAGLLEKDYKLADIEAPRAIPQVQAHVNAELERNISCLYSKASQSLRSEVEDFLPYELGIAPLRPLRNDFINIVKKPDQKDGLTNVYEMLSRGTKDGKGEFFTGVILGMLFSWLRNNLAIQSSVLLASFQDALTANEYTSTRYTSLISRINRSLGKSYSRSPFKSGEQLIHTLESALIKEDLSLARDPNMLVVKNRSPKGLQLLRKIVFLHRDASMSLSFLDFHWVNRVAGESVFRRLSAGEQARVSFFSRLSDAVEGRSSNEELRKDILLLIDEGDTYYHPEWQRKYFTDVLNAVRWFFGRKNVQLVITTNAPFMASDLPHWSVVYLDKDEKGVVRSRRPSRPDERTFAQNVHTLLAHAFFMDHTMGQFATTKINKIINLLSLPEEKRIADIEKLVSLIGEPVLRLKLSQMVSSQYGIETEIKLLETRLEDLRMKRNDSNKQT